MLLTFDKDGEPEDRRCHLRAVVVLLCMSMPSLGKVAR